MKQELKALMLVGVVIGLLWTATAWARRIGVVETGRIQAINGNGVAVYDDSGTIFWTFADGGDFEIKSAAVAFPPGPSLILENNTTSPAQYKSAGVIEFWGMRIGPAQFNYAGIFADADDATAFSEDGGLYLAVALAGGVVNKTTAQVAIRSDEVVFNDPSKDADFRVESDNDTHALFVQGSDGYVGIGTNAPAYALDVYADHASGYAAQFFNDGNTSLSFGVRIRCGTDSNENGDTYVQFASGDGNDNDALISYMGYIILASASDVRFKEKIERSKIYDAAGVRDALFDSGRVVDFNWKRKPNGKRVTGFVADELQQVFPDAVIERMVTVVADDGTTSIEPRLYIMPAKLIPLMFAEIQEQRAEKKALRQEVDTLKAAQAAILARLDALERATVRSEAVVWTEYK